MPRLALRYREASGEDCAAIASLHAESWRFAYRGEYRDEFLDGDVVADRLAVWEQRFREPSDDQYVVVAEAESGLVGFACVYGGEDARWGSLLDNLHVHRDHYRHRTGTRLVAEIAKWCLAHHPERGLFLWVLASNGRARSFYERLGACDRGGDVFVPPGGGQICSRRYAWTTLRELARAGERRTAPGGPSG